MSVRLGSAGLILLLLFTSGFAAEREDINTVGPDGTTPLHWAVRADDLQKVESLIRAGAKVNAADRYGITALNLASVNGNAQIVRKLLEVGADPNVVDLTGETVLMAAARTGTPDVLKFLMAP